jgi:membrane protein DedA with SNARE-associated domain
MKWRTFALFNAIGAALWVTTWSLVGYYGGDHIDLIERYGSYLAIAAAIAVIGYFGIKYLLKRRHHA